MEDLVRRPSPDFWAGKCVLVTGHTGFKGAWAVRMLAHLGAQVTGFALDPAAGPNAFAAIGGQRDLAADIRGDLCDRAAVKGAVEKARAEVVLHLAAQAIVSQGFADPARTWASNVTGTLYLLDTLRAHPPKATVIVTSDKVYRNHTARAFVEDDPLGGDDPYSASKAACEILVASYRASFPALGPIATARAGNVIGGGDFGRDRLIPDLVRAEQAGKPLLLRNPSATRPFQHVLDVIAGYLLLAEGLAKGQAPTAVNFGPAEAELSVLDLLAYWQRAAGHTVLWEQATAPALQEKPRLALDSGLARREFHWAPRMKTAAAVADTAQWYAAWARGDDLAPASDMAISKFLGEKA